MSVLFFLFLFAIPGYSEDLSKLTNSNYCFNIIEEISLPQDSSLLNMNDLGAKVYLDVGRDLYVQRSQEPARMFPQFNFLGINNKNSLLYMDDANAHCILELQDGQVIKSANKTRCFGINDANLSVAVKFEISHDQSGNEVRTDTALQVLDQSMHAISTPLENNKFIEQAFVNDLGNVMGMIDGKAFYWEPNRNEGIKFFPILFDGSHRMAMGTIAKKANILIGYESLQSTDGYKHHAVVWSNGKTYKLEDFIQHDGTFSLIGRILRLFGESFMFVNTRDDHSRILLRDYRAGTTFTIQDRLCDPDFKLNVVKGVFTNQQMLAEIQNQSGAIKNVKLELQKRD